MTPTSSSQPTFSPGQQCYWYLRRIPGQTREPFWQVPSSILSQCLRVSVQILFPSTWCFFVKSFADDNKPNFQLFINMFLCQYTQIYIYSLIYKYTHECVYSIYKYSVPNWRWCWWGGLKGEGKWWNPVPDTYLCPTSIALQVEKFL